MWCVVRACAGRGRAAGCSAADDEERERCVVVGRRLAARLASEHAMAARPRTACAAPHPTATQNNAGGAP
eukprot:930846-Prymnesium_polylepis.1